MKLGTETISVTNYLMSGTKGAPKPEVGMGATILMWSDRHAATIVGVETFKSGARKGDVSVVRIQEDKSVRVDGNGQSEDQQYEFVPNPNAPIKTYRVNSRGAFKATTGAYGTLRIGDRDEYRDPSF